jgi:hypothetical protein
MIENVTHLSMATTLVAIQFERINLGEKSSDLTVKEEREIPREVAMGGGAPKTIGVERRHGR